jgi:hypothetical protein
VIGTILDQGGFGLNLADPAYGVTFNTTVDQSAAVQRWLNALATVAASGKRACGILPSNSFVTIASTLTLQNVFGISIVGPGQGAFAFNWASASATTPMFRLSNCQECSFEGFAVVSRQETGLLDTAFHVQSVTPPPPPPYAPPSNHNVFRRITIEGTNPGGLNRGFLIAPGTGGIDANNDFMTLEHVAVFNYAQQAVSIQGYNVHNTQMLYCDFVSVPGAAASQAVHADQGFFSLRGGRIAGSTDVDFYIATPNGAVHISDVNVENSARLLFVDGPTGVPQPVTIQSVRWAANLLAADNLMIVQKGPGPLNLRGNVFGDANVTRTPQVQVTAIGTYGFVSQGNLWGGQSGLTTSPYVLQNGGTLPVRVSIEGDIFAYTPNGGTAQYNPRAFPNGASPQTPAVHTGHLFFAQYSPAVTITNLTQGYITQRVTIVALNGNTTIQNNGTTIKLKTAGNRTLATNDSVELLNIDGSVWVEV